MKLLIISHSLTSNAVMRAHRLGLAAQQFAEVTLVGPMKHRGRWGALPEESWIRPIESKNLPKFFKTTLDLIATNPVDVVLAVKPHLASYGTALLIGECRQIPVLLDIDDLDVELAPKTERSFEEKLLDLRDPASTLYLHILSKAISAATGITVASRKLQARFGGTLVPHGCPVERMNPDAVDREQSRKKFGFSGPVVVFPGTRRTHKGLKPLAKAVARIPGARLAVLCRPDDFTQPEWSEFPLIRLPLLPYGALPGLLAAADVVAVPQLDTLAASYQMPMKVYDAMAMARPIVATTVSDLPEVLDGCGRLVPPGDVSALAKAIRELLEHPAEAQKLGALARERCLRNYSMSHIARSLQHAIQTACARTTPVPVG